MILIRAGPGCAYCKFLCKIALFSQCGEWPYSFVTFVANKKKPFDIAEVPLNYLKYVILNDVMHCRD